MIGNRSEDIRNYLTCRRGVRHVEANDKGQGLRDELLGATINEHETLKCHPLYAMPLENNDVDGINVESDDGSHYSLESLDYDSELEKLQTLITSQELAWPIPLGLSALEYRLVRKLLGHEIKIHDGQVPDKTTINWLSSKTFMKGLQQLSLLLRTRELCQSPELGWVLFMVIEPVMRADFYLAMEETIASLALKQERLVLWWLAWQQESPLYLLLRLEDDILISNKRPRTRRDSLNITKSPGKALRSITSPVGRETTSTSTSSLEFFFRKYLRAAAGLVENLVTSLSLSIRVRGATWTLLMGILEDELQLKLHQGRHAWTIIACTIYSTAKLLDEDRSFSQIISAFIEGDNSIQWGDLWYRTIRLADEQNGLRQGDLVQFYNEIFLAVMRDRIYALREPITPRRSSSVPSIRSHAPFPSVYGSVAIARNIQFQISPTPRSVQSDYRTQESSAVRISMLGNLGSVVEFPNPKTTERDIITESERNRTRSAPRKLEL